VRIASQPDNGLGRQATAMLEERSAAGGGEGDQHRTRPGKAGPLQWSGGGAELAQWSRDITFREAGDYWWYASSAGDSNTRASSTACGPPMAETVVTAASPVLSLSAPTAGTAGTPMDARSIVASLASSSGSKEKAPITFKVFGPQAVAPTTCSSGGSVVGSGTTEGDGSYHSKSDFLPSRTGNYWWYASSPPDTNNTMANSGCGPGMAETVVGAPLR
jgi:hypothetical protein